MPARVQRHGTGTVFMHLVIMQQVSLGAVSTSLVWWVWLQLEHAYLAVEKHRARAVARMVDGSAPHLDFTSLRRMLLRVLTLALVFWRWVLKESVLTSVTLRYTGWEWFESLLPSNEMLISLPAP